MTKNNKLYKVTNGENTYLMLPAKDERRKNIDFDIVYTVPCSNIKCILEYEISYGLRTFIYYFDNNDKRWILESFDIALKHGHRQAINKNKRYINSEIKVLNPTTLCYKDEFDIETILSVYGNELQPQKSQISNSITEDILKITNITLGDYLDREKNEIILHIGTQEKLHIFIQSPTQEKQNFKVYRKIYSELTDEFYDIAPDSKDDFISYESFTKLFINSELAREIFIIIKNKQNRIRHQVLSLTKKENN